MVIEPPQSHDDTTPAHPSTGSSNDDLLAELREKTARLAAQVRGKEEQKPHHTLRIEPTPNEDQAVIDALMVADPSSESPRQKEVLAPVNPAVELIRAKLNTLYGKEPDAKEEEQEATHVRHRSKHQEFMYQLSTSGKSLAEIQTQWHHYYIALPDDEKHQVWQEFYENQASTTKPQQHLSNSNGGQKKRTGSPAHRPRVGKTLAAAPNIDQRTVLDIKNQLVDKITAGGALKPVHHFKSLLFGLAMASLVGLIMTFTFFNEVIIAPFISPARAITTTPIIGDGTGTVGPEPKIIIPKINLEVPVVFNMNSIVESDVQKALEEGVVHYANTPNPGEQGNAVIVGHSSNNILNSGKYKFAFVLLKRLEAEDTFFVQKDSVRYTYKVYEKKIVGPDDISVLETQSRPNTVTLITCDPPGTSVNRLIVFAEQIAPDPANNAISTATVESNEPAILPSNAPSLWSRLWPF